MAVKILENPPAVAFAGNPVKFKVQAATYLLASAAKAVVDIGFDDAFNLADLTDGDTIDLVVDGQQFVFTFAGGSSISLGELPRSVLPGDDNYATSLIGAFNANYYISRNYDLTVKSDNDFCVVFTAKNNGAEYTIGTVSSFADTVTLISSVVTVGAIAAYEPNRFVRADIFIEEVYDTDTYTLFASLKQQIIDTDVLTFDLSNRLERYFDDKSEKLNIAFDGVVRMDEINKRYKVEFSEFNAGQYKYISETTTSSVYRVHKGGVKTDEYRLFPDLVADYIEPKLKPLSWRPSRRSITTGSTDHLYFLKHSTFNSALKCVVKLWYSDGSNNNFTDSTLTALNDFESFAWNVGYSRILAQATVPSGETLVQYACYWKAHNDVDLCEPTYFRVVDSNHLDRHFYYENSFGCFELLRTNSVHSYGVAANKGENQVTLADNADYNEGGVKDYTFDFIEKYKGSTGNMQQQEALVVVDFLLSNLRFLKRGSRLMNIVVETNSAEPYEDDGFPYGFSFTYKRADKQRYFSNLIEVGFEEKVFAGSGDAASDDVILIPQ